MKARNDQLAYSIKDFCVAASIGRTKLNELFADGTGPRTVSLGKRRFILRSDAEAWLNTLPEKSAGPRES